MGTTSGRKSLYFATPKTHDAGRRSSVRHPCIPKRLAPLARRLVGSSPEKLRPGGRQRQYNRRRRFPTRCVHSPKTILFSTHSLPPPPKCKQTPWLCQKIVFWLDKLHTPPHWSAPVVEPAAQPRTNGARHNQAKSEARDGGQGQEVSAPRHPPFSFSPPDPLPSSRLPSHGAPKI